MEDVVAGQGPIRSAGTARYGWEGTLTWLSSPATVMR
jgi:hypothetical protein